MQSTDPKEHAMQTAKPKTKASPFETRPCGRCGGSGHYSYCQMHGTRCFGCSGSGLALTKRGSAAREFFLASLQRTYDEVEVGWRVLVSGSGWRTVTAVEVGGSWGGRYENYGTPEQKLIPFTHSITTGIDAGRVNEIGNADSRISGYADRDEYDAKLAAALAFQATLTLNGEPRKRAKANTDASNPIVRASARTILAAAGVPHVATCPCHDCFASREGQAR